jgi:hypothetical protein
MLVVWTCVIRDTDKDEVICDVGGSGDIAPYILNLTLTENE